MPRSDPFDFSEFGAGRPARTPPAQAPTTGQAPGRPPNRGFDTGFDPFADQRSSGPDADHGDAFGRTTADALGAQTLAVARPPLALFALAIALAAVGLAIGLAWGPRPAAAFAGWLLAGPVAIGVLAEFSRVDTRRRGTEESPIPAAPSKLLIAQRGRWDQKLRPGASRSPAGRGFCRTTQLSSGGRAE